MQRTSRAQAPARRPLRAVIPGNGGVYNPLDEITVFHPRLGCGIGHVVAIADEGIRVGLQHPDAAVIRQPDIETAIIAQPQRPVSHPAGLGDSLAHRFREGAGQDVPDSLALSVPLVPLGELGSDPLFGPGLPFIENHLRERKDLQAIVIANDADVKLATVDKLFRDCALAESLMDERHAFRERLLVLHHRSLGDARGGIGLQRLDDQGKGELGGAVDRLVQAVADKVRHLDSEIGENLFADGLVAAHL
jgi:hypothetical protein